VPCAPRPSRASSTRHPCRDDEGFGILPRPAARAKIRLVLRCSAQSEGGWKNNSNRTQRRAGPLCFSLLMFRAPLGALRIAARAGDVRAWMPAKHRHGRKPCRCGSPSTREAQGTVQSTARTRGVLSLGYFSLHEQREVCPPNRGGMKNLRAPVMQRGEALDHSVHRGSPMASVGLRFAPTRPTISFRRGCWAFCAEIMIDTTEMCDS